MLFFRFFRILAVTARYRLDELFIPFLPRGVRLLFALSPLRLIPARASRSVRLRQALETLGPIAVKFGQALSTRRDLLPEDIAQELSCLQDQVPPFPAWQAREIVEAALGAQPEALFQHFEEEPLASASVAQVHCAVLQDGRQVVVKVLRPKVEEEVQQDLALLFTAAKWLEKLLPASRRLQPVAVVEEYQDSLLKELDLRVEAANTSHLRRNFADSPLLYVPEVHWDYSCREVLVLERIYGVPVDDLASLNAQGVDLRKLAERGAEIFFIQVFHHNFFHADMHPGNVYVDTQTPSNPHYIALDCAVIGSLERADLYYLARNLLAIFQRDYRQVAELHIECGWVPSHVRLHELETAVRTVCEPLFARPLGEISLGRTLVDLLAIARRFDMEVQPSLVLLQKTLLQVEGLGRQLYPALNLWDIGRPLLEDWLRKRYSPSALYRLLRHRLPGWLEQLPELPDLLFSELKSAAALRRLLQSQESRLRRVEQAQKNEFF